MLRLPISRYFTPCRAARLNHRVIMLEESLIERDGEEEGRGMEGGREGREGGGENVS